MTKSIVAVLGDFYHNRDVLVNGLEKAVSSLDEEVSISYATPERLVEKLSTNPDVVVLSTENRINPQDDDVQTWMDEEVAKAIAAYVENGGTWLAWHSGLASYEDIPTYTSLLHGYFKYHPVEHQTVTYQVEPSDLYDKAETFAILDEHYFVQCDEEKTNVFMRSESVDGSSIAGWHHNHGKGKVICFTPAHLEEGVMHPVVQQLLTKCLQFRA